MNLIEYWSSNAWLTVLFTDGANIEIAEEVGEQNVCEFCAAHILLPCPRAESWPCLVFFGHLTPAVEDLRYQHMYHPVPIGEKCPALAKVIDLIAGGLFGDAGVYEPYVPRTARLGRVWLTGLCAGFVRLLNTIRNYDHYLLTEDFDSCGFESRNFSWFMTDPAHRHGGPEYG